MEKNRKWLMLAALLLLLGWGGLQLRTHVLDLERQAVAQQNKAKEANAAKKAKKAKIAAEKAAAAEEAVRLEARKNNYSLSNLVAYFNQQKLLTGQDLTLEAVAEYFSELRLAELGLTEEARILIDPSGTYQGASPEQLIGGPYLLQVGTAEDGQPIYKDLMSEEATTVAEARATLLALLAP